ncbi:unnamed protein product [Auanema sp. JU1783]|nr:unnamed protein product [Auanema sp. JU1783]
MSSFNDEEGNNERAIRPIKTSDKSKIVALPRTLTTRKEIRSILPEDEYIDKLDQIITKNYFPEVNKMKAQIEYVNAVTNNDVVKIRELQHRFNTQRRTDRRTSPSYRMGTQPKDVLPSPAQFDPDTPGPSRGRANSPPRYTNIEGNNDLYMEKKKLKKDKDVENLSIDGFFSKYTSEDNASFEELAVMAQKREQEKNKWIYEAAEKHNKELVVQQAIAADADVQLALKYEREAKNDKPLALDNWAFKARSSVLFYPEGAELTVEEKVEQAKRNQRIINKEATRFPDDVKNKVNTSSVNRTSILQAAFNSGKVDITGKEAGAPQMDVLATPTPAPGVDDTPLMTWGEIDGTPFRLDATDVVCPPEDAPAFKMPEVPQRELVAQGMTDKISKQYRERKRAAMEIAERAHKTPSFGSVRSTNARSIFSPAAKQLSNKLGIRLGSGSSLLRKEPITPNVRTPWSTSSAHCASPSSVSSMVRLKKPPPKISITDNLMNINDAGTGDDESMKGASRPKASDFF